MVISGKKNPVISAINKNTDFNRLPKNCFKPSKFMYLTFEAIKNAKIKTMNRNINGGGRRVYFLYNRINEANMPPLTVVGRP